MNILLVEDDIQLNKAVKTYLQIKENFVVSSVEGDDAIDLIDIHKFDLCIIDINIANVNGLELVQYIRKQDHQTKIIIITASSEVDYFLQAYEYGCDEYIKKPFHLQELEVRMNNLFDKTDSSIVDISKTITYDVKFDELIINNENIKLRKKEKRLLSLLIQNINHTVKNENIIDYVWENEIKEKYPLRQLLSELRNKFPSDTDYIKTEVGIGYRFEN